MKPNLRTSERSEKKALESIKAYICLFRMEGHKTYRIAVHPTIEGIEKQFREQIGKNKVVAKKFFEINRLEGTFEEF